MSAIVENAKILVSSSAKLGVTLTAIDRGDHVTLDGVDALRGVIVHRLGERAADEIGRSSWFGTLDVSSVDQARAIQSVISRAIAVEERPMSVEDVDLLSICAEVFPSPVALDAAIGVWADEAECSIDDAAAQIESARERGLLAADRNLYRLSGDFDLRALLSRLGENPSLGDTRLVRILVDAAILEGKLTSRRA